MIEIDVKRTPRLMGLGVAVLVAVIALLGVSAAVRSEADAPLPTVEGDGGPVTDGGSTRPITVSGSVLVRDGQPWWFLGYNSFVWSGNCGSGAEKMSAAQVDAWFASMRHDGHGAVRLYFFPGWSTQRLDQTVAAAKKYGVYVTITLGDALANCGQEKKDAAWFADSTQQAAYQQHLVSVVSRYRGDPTVAWFEYLNEPGWADGALRTFYDRMGAAGKRADPTRLFASGTIAPYALGGADNYRDATSSPGVDLASLHEYDEDRVESTHGPESKAAADGKPVVVGEVGVVAGRSCGKSFDDRARILREKAAVYTGDGYAGAFVWAWQPGGSGCVLGNLDQDGASQAVLRAFARGD